MATRITDAITKAIAQTAHAISVYTRASQGLPLTMVQAIQVAASSTQSLTMTATTDIWVNGISTNLTTVAMVLVDDARITRMEIAGFLIYEDQGTDEPLFMDTTGGRAGYNNPQGYHGFPTPFVMRQGDVLTVTCENNDAGAVAVLSVKVDAYRCSMQRPG